MLVDDAPYIKICWGEEFSPGPQNCELSMAKSINNCDLDIV